MSSNAKFLAVYALGFVAFVAYALHNPKPYKPPSTTTIAQLGTDDYTSRCIDHLDSIGMTAE